MDPSNQSSSLQCHFLLYEPDKILKARTVYYVAVTLNSLLIFPTSVLNVLLLSAMYHSSALRKPPTLLLYSLATSDLLLGLATEPVFLAKKIGELTDNFDIYCKAGLALYSFGYLTTTVSFLTLTAIGIDRYLLVTSGVEYSSRVTKSRMISVIAAIWIFVLALVAAQFFVKRSVTFTVVAAIIASCVVMTTAIYVTAMYKIRKQQQRLLDVSDGPRTQYAANISRYKKSTVTMLLVSVVFILCYTPFLGCAIAATLTGESAEVWSAESISGVLAYSNGMINPIILFWRMNEIREAGKKSIRRLTKLSGFSPERSKYSNGRVCEDSERQLGNDNIGRSTDGNGMACDWSLTRV